VGNPGIPTGGVLAVRGELLLSRFPDANFCEDDISNSRAAKFHRRIPRRNAGDGMYVTRIFVVPSFFLFENHFGK
jgi:hypothetical protein